MCRSCCCCSMALAGAPTALALSLESPQPPSILMGGSHRGCHSCSLCDPKCHLRSLPAACCHPAVSPPGSPELRPASKKEEHSSLLQGAPRSLLVLPSLGSAPAPEPFPRAGCVSLVAPRAVCHHCSPGTAPPCPPPLPSATTSPPSPCLVTSSAAPGPQEQNKELPVPQVGREGTGGDTLQAQQPEELGLCSFDPSDTSSSSHSGICQGSEMRSGHGAEGVGRVRLAAQTGMQ